MPVFRYRGVKEDGKEVTGLLEAESQKVAVLKIRKEGVFPFEIKEGEISQKRVSLDWEIDFKRYLKRIRTQDTALMTRQLSTLLSAGIPLVDSLNALKDQVENEKLKLILTEVKERVNEGSSFADALSKHPRVFSELYINMIAAGEQSGALDLVLLRLADYTEDVVRLKNRITGTLVYPVIMLFVGAGIVTFLLTFVIPKISKIFIDMKATLPFITRALLFVSGLLSEFWYIFLIVIGLLIFLGRRYLKTPKGREMADTLSLRMPVFGRLSRMVAISRFSKTLSTLLSSGVPLLTSMNIVRNIVGNVKIKKAIEVAKENIAEGQSIAGPLKESGEFPPMVIHMISVGERSGELEGMLMKVSESYDAQVETTVNILTSLLEPVLILMMGGIVGFIALSVLLPMLQLNQIIK